MATIIQFTGLSGAGKTSLAEAVEMELAQLGYRVCIIDGDIYRQSLCKDLGFSKVDRMENIARLGKYAWEQSSKFDLIIIAVINPFDESREMLKQKYGALLVYIHCDLSILKKRDTKGLYRRAGLAEGAKEKIYNLTGVNDVYDEPRNPDLILNTTNTSLHETTNQLKNYLLAIL